MTKETTKEKPVQPLTESDLKQMKGIQSLMKDAIGTVKGGWDKAQQAMIQAVNMSLQHNYNCNLLGYFATQAYRAKEYELCNAIQDCARDCLGVRFREEVDPNNEHNVTLIAHRRDKSTVNALERIVESSGKRRGDHFLQVLNDEGFIHWKTKPRSKAKKQKAELTMEAALIRGVKKAIDGLNSLDSPAAKESAKVINHKLREVYDYCREELQAYGLANIALQMVQGELRVVKSNMPKDEEEKKEETQTKETVTKEKQTTTTASTIDDDDLSAYSDNVEVKESKEVVNS